MLSYKICVYTMFKTLWNFAKRHKKKFIVTGFVAGGGVLLYEYAKKKLLEFEHREAADCIEHAKRQHHFDSNQRTCNITVVSMLPNLREAISKLFHTEDIFEALNQNPSNKIELWEQMKIMSFARAVTVVYGCSMMPLLLRVQLNIIGGYLYLDNLLGQNGVSEEITMVPPAVQEEYLSLIRYFFSDGLHGLGEAIHKAVSKEVGSIPLKERLTVHNIEAVVKQIHQRVENGDSGIESGNSSLSICDFLLPPEKSAATVSTNVKLSREGRLYERLVTETRDVIESKDFQCVLRVCLDRGIARLLDHIAEHYRQLQAAEKQDPQLHELSIPIAKLLPVIDGALFKLCSDTPNPLIQELLLLEQTRGLAANIYEAFSQHGDVGENDKSTISQLQP